MQPRADLNDEEASKLGMKNEDDEVEKFVMANTQELGEEEEALLLVVQTLPWLRPNYRVTRLLWTSFCRTV